MNEQILEELGIELKKLELKEDDVLIVEYDLDKINPRLAGDFLQIIQNNVNNKVIPCPKGMSISKNGVKNIIRIRDKFNKEVDKILKGEE